MSIHMYNRYQTDDFSCYHLKTDPPSLQTYKNLTMLIHRKSTNKALQYNSKQIFMFHILSKKQALLRAIIDRQLDIAAVVALIAVCGNSGTERNRDLKISLPTFARCIKKLDCGRR